MANKIPVFRTVSRAWGFLLGEAGTIVRLAWAPLLIASALNFAYGKEALEVAMRAGTNPAAATEIAGTNMLIGLISSLAGIMALVALLKVVILGDRKPDLVVYLWFGAAEARLVLVYVLLVIAIIAGAIGLSVGIALMAVVPGADAVIGILGLVLVIALLVAGIRLTLIPAVVVAEKNLGVEGAWALGSGNVLRLIAIFILTYLPFAVIAALANFAVVGADMPAWPDLSAMANGKPDPDLIRKTMIEWQNGMLGAMVRNWEAVSLLNLIGAFMNTALYAGIVGNAYLSASGRE